MGAADDGLLIHAQAARRVHRPTTRWLLSFLLCTLALTAIVAVVTAIAMGQPTVAFAIGLVSAAFFAGILC